MVACTHAFGRRGTIARCFRAIGTWEASFALAPSSLPFIHPSLSSGSGFWFRSSGLMIEGAHGLWCMPSRLPFPHSFWTKPCQPLTPSTFLAADCQIKFWALCFLFFLGGDDLLFIWFFFYVYFLMDFLCVFFLGGTVLSGLKTLSPSPPLFPILEEGIGPDTVGLAFISFVIFLYSGFLTLDWFRSFITPPSLQRLLSLLPPSRRNIN